MGYVFRQAGRKNWMMKYYREGKPITVSTGTDNERDAKKELRNRETDVDRGLPVSAAVGKLRFSEAANDIEAEYIINERKSLNVLQRRIKKHLKPYFDGRRMATITKADITAFVQHRLAQPIVTGKGKARHERRPSNAEINRELTTLKRMFTLARQNGKLLYQPHIEMLVERKPRKGFFEAAAFRSVCAHLPTELAQLMRVAYVTGWRIDSELLPLEWRQIDFDERLTPSQRVPGTIRLDAGTTKNGEGRVFPFTEELREVLTAQRDERDQRKQAGQLVPWVFWRMVADERGGEQKPRRIKKFVKAWKVACVAAGQPGRIPHDLRRTAVRNLVRAGVPERVAMQLTGHKTRSVFERYNIVSSGDLGLAAERIDAAANAETVSAPAPTAAPKQRGGDQLRVVGKRA